MNNSGKAYDGLIEKLVAIDKKTKAWREFLEKLLNGRAEGVGISLTMKEKKPDKVDYVKEEEKVYGEIRLSSLMWNPFERMATESAAEAGRTPEHEIREEMATQLCQGVLQQLDMERKGLLAKLGILTAKQDA